MRRREYLAGSAALLAGTLAGCAHPNAVLIMESVTDSELAERASRSVPSDHEDRAIVSEAVENGSANATGRSPPLDPDEPVAFEGRYYELTATEVGEREKTTYVIEIVYGDDVGAPDDGTVDFEALPEVDREAIRPLLPLPDGASRGGEQVEREYTRAEADASVLVPEPAYDVLVYDGEQYPIHAGRATRTEREYRYEAEEVAGSAAAFAESLRSEYLFTLSGLSDAERDVVTEAIDDGYYEGSADDAFSSVASRFRDHPGLDTDEWGGNWLVRYDGVDYWAELQHPPSAVES